jgi:NAD(P)-dependent dehydrogenase (short-subunit alcohol dehydrogenase family)
MRLQGRRISILASARGIGRARALASTVKGVEFVAGDMNLESRRSLSNEPGYIEADALDVHDDAAVATFFRGQKALNGLCNCSGLARQPSDRLATVDDITPALVYLSDESRFVRGQALLIDGGVTI